MKQRGRRSEASVALALTTQTDLKAHPRPDAPYDLSDEEADVWRGVVNRLPASWFEIETFPLLAQYCRHVVRARRIAEMVRQFETPAEDSPFSMKDYLAVLRAQQSESRAIAMLATKMRIAQQSTIDKESKKKGVGVARPWQS